MKIIFESSRTYLIRTAEAWLGPDNVMRPAVLAVKNGTLIDPASISSEQVEELDLGRVLAIPGLIDSHVHLSLDPGGLPDLKARVELALEWGLAGVRDGGDKNSLILKTCHDPEAPLAINSPGPALFRPGRYGAFLGRPVSGRKEIIEAVREIALAGADYIKVLASGPVGLKYFGQVGPPQFEIDDMRALVAAAGEQGLYVMAHANGPQAVEMCIRAGVGSLEHGYFMGEKALGLLAEKGTIWVPTIVPLAALAGQAQTSPDQVELIGRIINDQVGQLTLAREVGVRTAVGSDAGSPGNPAGPGLYREISFFLQAGYSIYEVITAALTNGAELMRTSRNLGFGDYGRPARFVGLGLDSPLEESGALGPVVVAGQA